MSGFFAVEQLSVKEVHIAHSSEYVKNKLYYYYYFLDKCFFDRCNYVLLNFGKYNGPERI